MMRLSVLVISRPFCQGCPTVRRQLGISPMKSVSSLTSLAVGAGIQRLHGRPAVREIRRSLSLCLTLCVISEAMQ